MEQREPYGISYFNKTKVRVSGILWWYDKCEPGFEENLRIYMNKGHTEIQFETVFTFVHYHLRMQENFDSNSFNFYHLSAICFPHTFALQYSHSILYSWVFSLCNVFTTMIIQEFKSNPVVKFNLIETKSHSFLLSPLREREWCFLLFEFAMPKCLGLT